MRVLHAAEAVTLQVEPFEDVQHLQRGDALCVRRQLPYVVTAVICRHRFHPFRLVLRQIGRREKPAVPLQKRPDDPRGFAPVKRLAPAGGHPFHRRGQTGIAEHLTLHRRPPARQIHHTETRLIRDIRRAIRPIVRDHFRHGKALARVTNCRREHILHGQLAELAVQLEPAIHAARHTHAQRAALGNLLDPPALDLVRLQHRERERARRTPAGVQPVQPARCRVPHDGEQVPAGAATHRLHDAEHRVRGNRRIHRRAALLEDVQRRLRGQRLARASHPMLRQHFGPRDETPADGTIVRKGE